MRDLNEEQDWFLYFDGNGREIQVSGTKQYDPLTQVRVETAHRRWRDEEAQEVTRHASLALRLTFPQEMEALLHYNGFVVIERYGAWDFSPLTGESSMMIYVCRKAD